MKSALATLAIVASLITPTKAQSKPEMVSALDFAVSAAKYVGSRITVTGCIFNQARIATARCSVVVDDTNVGYFNIDTRNLPPDDQKNIIVRCTSFIPDMKCKGGITGYVQTKSSNVIMIAEKILFWF